MNKNEAKKKIQELIDKYLIAVKTGKDNKYSEEETKKGFIEPLFKILGWDITNNDEVSAEESQSGGRVDYGFYIGNRPKFFLEAKSFKADIQDEEYAKQAIRYSWNKGITWAILTNFERIKVFNAQNIESRYLADKRLFEIPYNEYLQRFDQLWQLSKESFEIDSIDKYAEQIGKKLQKVSVSATLYKDLSICRDILTNSISKCNPKLDQDLIDEGVQRLLDRLIFIRVAEDRKIEPPTLIPLLHEWESKHRGKIPVYQSMIKKFRELDETYNSNLFSKHSFENWEEYGGATEKIIPILYGKEGYYEYDFKVMPADVLGSVYENYLGYRLSKSKKGTTISKDAKKRKEQGIYYTPTFIVDYIVKNALQPILDNCKSINDLKKIKVLDPACGSGSFLINALEIINDKYKEFGNKGDAYTKFQILTENLYGVDLDPQAVEIARLNLLVSALDERTKLPVLTNIKNGNSLISGTDEELKKYFGNDFTEKKPFNWKEEFPDILEHGGFDIIIGNPPYIGVKEQDENFRNYIRSEFKYSSGADIYVAFIEKSMELLKNKGILAFICPNKFFGADYGKDIRTEIHSNWNILRIWDLKDEKVFHDALISTVVIIIAKQNQETSIILKHGSKEQKVKSVFDNSNKIQIDSNTEARDIISIINNQKPLNEIADIRTGVMGFEYWHMKDIISEKSGSNKVRLYTNGNFGRYNDKWESQEISLYKSKYKTPFIEINKEYLNNNTIDLFKTKPKILVRGVSKEVAAIIDRVGSGLLVAVHAIVPKKEEDTFYLQAVINSRLINWYHLQTFYSVRIPQGSLKYPVSFFSLLPIPRSTKTDKNIISKLVKTITELYRKLQSSEEDSNQWLKLKDEIAKTDKKIDEEVYKLYGLTPGGIKAIENQPR